MHPLTIISLATHADEDAIKACARAAYARYVPRIGREPAPMSADYAAQIAAQHVYVARDECGALAGFVVFYPQGNAMHLENIAVQPALTGRGIGRQLIAFCEDAARRAGFARVALYTNEKMTENIALYPRLGYVEIDRRREDGFNRVYFQKFLNN